MAPNASHFDWSNQLQPYYVANGATKGQLSPTINLLSNCNSSAVNGTNTLLLPAYNFYWYTPSSSSPLAQLNPNSSYLMCGNWPAVTNNYSNTVSNQMNALALQNNSNGNYININAQFPVTLVSNTPNSVYNFAPWSVDTNAWHTDPQPLGAVTQLQSMKGFPGGSTWVFSYTSLQYVAADGFIGSIVLGFGQGGYSDWWAINGNINSALNNLQFQTSTGAVASPINTQCCMAGGANPCATTVPCVYQESGYGSNNIMNSGDTVFQFTQNGNIIALKAQTCYNNHNPNPCYSALNINVL
jgi:hypothetical protein